MDEKNAKRPVGEDTLNEILASAEQHKPAEHTITVEVDDKFRDFFTTSVAVIPDNALPEEDAPAAPKKKGLLGWLSGLFRREEEAEANEVMIPGRTEPQPQPEPEQTGEVRIGALDDTGPVDVTMQIDLPMVNKEETERPADATGEIRLPELEQEEPPAQPARGSGGIRFFGSTAEKPAEKNADKAEPAPAPMAEQPAPAEEEIPAPAAPRKKVDDADIDAILAELLPGKAKKAPAPAEEEAVTVEESAEQQENEPLPDDALKNWPGAMEAVQQTQEEEEADQAPTIEVPTLADLPHTPAPVQDDSPTGEIVLFAPEQTEEAIEQAATRELPALNAEPAVTVEHSTYEPQVVAVEEPTGEVTLTPADEPLASTADLEDVTRAAQRNQKARTAAVRLFGNEEEPETDEAPTPEAEEPAKPAKAEKEKAAPEPVAEPEPAAAEYEDPADADAVKETLRAGVAKLTVRLVLTGVAAAALLVLGLTAQGILSLGAALDPELAPQAFLGVNLILLLAAAGVSWPIVYNGLRGLVGKPSPDTLPALAAVAAVVQLLACLLAGDAYDPAKLTLYASVAALVLFADTLGARLMQGVVRGNFDLVTAGVDHSAAYCLKDKNLAQTLTAGMEGEEPNLLLSRPAALVKGFVAQSFSARRSDASARKLARILLAAAAVGAVLGAVRGGGPLGAVSAFAGILCLGAPLSSTLIAAMPSLLMQRAASRVGAVVPGWYNVEQLGRVNMIQVDAADLFTPGCARLEGIKTFRKERIDHAILYATSVLIQGCNTLEPHFRAMIENRTEMLYEVRDLEKKPGLGFVAWCENRRVVLGTRALMAQEDIALPPLDYERRYTKDDDLQALYLAVSGQLYALLVLKYKGERNVARSLSTLKHSDIRLLVTADDPSLTAERIEAAYHLKPGWVKVLSADERTAIEPAVRYMPASEGCMMHLGSLASLVGGLRAAAGASQGEQSAGMVQFVSVVFSAVLGLFLAGAGGIAALSLLAVLLYQLAWGALSVAITLIKKY